MSGLHILLTFAISVMVASLTDWYFFGVLFHSRYALTPGVWTRYRDKRDEARRIGLAQAMMSLSSLGFILACAHFRLSSVGSTLLAALTVWLMIPVPLLASNAVFIPMDRAIVVSHSLGWLFRLIIAALCISWLAH